MNINRLCIVLCFISKNTLSQDLTPISDTILVLHLHESEHGENNADVLIFFNANNLFSKIKVGNFAPNTNFKIKKMIKDTLNQGSKLKLRVNFNLIKNHVHVKNVKFG